MQTRGSVSWAMAGLTVAACCVATHDAGAQEVVRDGKPLAEVVVPADAPAAEAFAAQDLCHWIREITGAEVPLLAKPSTAPNTKLCIGKQLAAPWKTELAELKGTDGFAVRRKDKEVFVFGDRPRGTLYGVYALLEANTDIIWARPAADFGTIFGQTPTLTLTQTETLEKPAFRLRGWNICSLRNDRNTGVWCMRNRINLPIQTPVSELDPLVEYGGGHGLLTHQAMEACFKSHPDYFAWDQFQKNRSKSAFCLSTPELPDLVVKSAQEKIARAPVRPEQANIGLQDTWRVCHCEACTKPIRLADGSMLEMKGVTAEKDQVFRSTQFYLFMNKVVERWKAAMPDTDVATLAYIYTAEPPRCEVHPGLRVLFAPYPTNNERLPLLHPDQPPTWRERFQAWLKLTHNLAFYQYYSPNMRHLARTAAADLRELAKAGGAGIISEIGPDVPRPGEGSPQPLSYNWDINPIEAWVLNRLFWDPNQDVDGLRRHYIRRAFREAAPAMEKYYALLLGGLEDPNDKSESNCHTPDIATFRKHVVDKKLEAPCRQALVEAEKAARHPHSLALVKALRGRFEAIADSLGRVFATRMPEAAGKKVTFDSDAWAGAGKLEDFKVPLGDVVYGRATNVPTHPTELRVMHDGQTLHVKLVAFDDKPSAAVGVERGPAREPWPKGDHFELMLNDCVFAFDCRGNAYDAKDWDKTWNSGWTMSARTTDSAWEAVAAIPLDKIGFDAQAGKPLRAFFSRHYDHGQSQPEESTFRGGRFTVNTYELFIE